MWIRPALLAVVGWVVALLVSFIQALKLFGVLHNPYQSVLRTTVSEQHGWPKLLVVFYEWVFPLYVLYFCLEILRSRKSTYWKVGAAAVSTSVALGLLARVLNRQPWLGLNSSISSAVSFVALTAILVGVPLWFRSRMRYV